jgi:hypothetical protein
LIRSYHPTPHCPPTHSYSGSSSGLFLSSCGFRSHNFFIFCNSGTDWKYLPLIYNGKNEGQSKKMIKKVYFQAGEWLKW